MKRYFKLRHYLILLKRQPSHTQHIAAGVFAGIITACIAAVILYYDYGFWHDTYSNKEEKSVVEDTMVTVQSPSEMIGGFLKEATAKFNDVTVSRKNILEGKDIYTKSEH